MIDVEALVASELERMLPLPGGGRANWADVLDRAGVASLDGRALRVLLRKRRPRPWRWQRVVTVGVAVAALIGAAVAIADGLGAFNGIRAADHPQTGTDVLDRHTVAQLQQRCDSKSVPFYRPQCHLVLGSARLIGRLPSGHKLYVITDTHGDLCVINPGIVMTCGPGLTPSRPITETSVGQLTFGVARDGVTAVSFKRSGTEVTVPVKDNVWVYQGVSLPEAGALTVHFDNGKTVTLHP